jgi:hypothetical protein
MKHQLCQIVSDDHSDPDIDSSRDGHAWEQGYMGSLSAQICCEPKAI